MNGNSHCHLFVIHHHDQSTTVQYITLVGQQSQSRGPTVSNRRKFTVPVHALLSPSMIVPSQGRGVTSCLCTVDRFRNGPSPEAELFPPSPHARFFFCFGITLDLKSRRRLCLEGRTIDIRDAVEKVYLPLPEGAWVPLFIQEGMFQRR